MILKSKVANLAHSYILRKLKKNNGIILLRPDKGNGVVIMDRNEYIDCCLTIINDTGRPHKQCVCLCSKYKEMYGRILKSLNIVNLYRGMFKLKLKINVKVPQLTVAIQSPSYKTL